MQSSPYSFRAIAAAFGDFLVDIDTGLLSMLRRLCTAPGELIARQLSLKDKVFREPLRLFVFANFVFFLVAPHVGLFRSSLHSFESSSGLHARVVLEQRHDYGLSPEVYEERFDHHLDFRQPTFAILLVPLLALLAKMFDPRRPFGVALMTSLYAVSWILLSWPLLLAAVDTLLPIVGENDADVAGLSKAVLLTGCTMQWFVRVQLGGYGRRFGAALAHGLLLTGSWVLAMLAYEQLMFWITWALLPAD